MNRYFLEVAYIGSNYAGFQIQKNASTVQSEIESALHTLLRIRIPLTGSSRTDAGVHALQNYFHFDVEVPIEKRFIYNINAVLPPDIAIQNLIAVKPGSHCRFDAVLREYAYHIYWCKNPFLVDRAYYYPYKINLEKLQAAAMLLLSHNDYSSFSKRRTQVKSYECKIIESAWEIDDDRLLYRVKANRFLRGMVRGLVGTMLQVGRGRLQVEQFEKIIEERNSAKVDFSVQAKGLYLNKVLYPEDFFTP